MLKLHNGNIIWSIFSSNCTIFSNHRVTSWDTPHFPIQAHVIIRSELVHLQRICQLGVPFSLKGYNIKPVNHYLDHPCSGWGMTV